MVPFDSMKPIIPPSLRRWCFKEADALRRIKQNGLQICRQTETTASAGLLLPLLTFAAGNGLMALTGVAMPWLPALTGAALCLMALPFHKRVWFPCGALALLVLSLLLLLRRRYILNKRKAILYQEDIREAAAWGFADAVSLLELLGIRRGNGSLAELTAPIAQRFGAELARQFDAAARANARALFSCKPMTEAQREAVLVFRSGVLVMLQEQSNRLSRLWMKYILCRF